MSKAMSIKARFLQKQYQMGRLDNETLKQYVVVGQITEEDYKAITDVDYVAVQE